MYWSPCRVSADARHLPVLEEPGSRLRRSDRSFGRVYKGVAGPAHYSLTNLWPTGTPPCTEFHSRLAAAQIHLLLKPRVLPLLLKENPHELAVLGLCHTVKEFEFHPIEGSVPCPHLAAHYSSNRGQSQSSERHPDFLRLVWIQASCFSGTNIPRPFTVQVSTLGSVQHLLGGGLSCFTLERSHCCALTFLPLQIFPVPAPCLGAWERVHGRPTDTNRATGLELRASQHTRSAAYRRAAESCSVTLSKSLPVSAPSGW